MLDQLYANWRTALTTGEGIDTATEEFFKDLRSFVEAVIWNTLRRRDECLKQDICTEIFMKAKNFRGEANFATWAWRVAYLQCMLELRRKYRRNEVALADIMYEPAALEQPESELMARFAGLREVLSREDCEMIDLYLKGWTRKEIAEKLGIPIGRIRSMRRALKNRVMRALGKSQEQPEEKVEEQPSEGS